jgi:hypothetical protein
VTTQTISITDLPGNLTSEQVSTQKSIVTRILAFASSLDRVGMGLLRTGLVVVLLWIGGL